MMVNYFVATRFPFSQLSLIVPQATAGLIIGKGGSRVKSIQEESNCHINLTQKNEQLPTNERVVTIQNNESKSIL